MFVSNNQKLARAIAHALGAAGVVALGLSASHPAHSQEAAGSQSNAAQATPTRAKPTPTKAQKKVAPIRVAQATGPQTVAQAGAGSGSGSAAPQLQEVVITGSLIARTSVETANPVQVVTSKDLVQSGYTDISTVLKNITANGANTLSQSFSGAFAAGASGISLRGLTVGDTLVLIDGERSVPYPLLDDNQRSFVDLASIPFTAVDSVQVDKNGASAVYGSDAIAGVVNVLLKKEYQGFMVSGEGGTSEHGDGTTEHLGFIGGQGDLSADGYNWYVSGEFRHQDQVLLSHRSGLWDDLDWTPFGGTYGGVSDIGASLANNPIFPYPDSTTGYFIDPATGNVVDYLPGCNAVQQSMNKCLAVDPGAQLVPPTTRMNILGKFTKKLSDGWTLGLQASWFNSSSQETAGYVSGSEYASSENPLSGVTNLVFSPGEPLTAVPASSLQTPNLVTIPSTNPMYPACTTQSWCGSPLAFQYGFPEVGNRGVQTNANTYRLLLNLDGTAAGWDIHATGGAMYAKMAFKITGQINWQELQTALDNGYVFGSQGAAGLFAPTMETTPWSELDLLDVHGQHKLFELPGGPVELAVGVQYYKKVQDEHAPPAAVSGAQGEGGGPVYVIGTEKDAAGFVEVDGKPIKQLEIDAAGRFDNIQGVGSAGTPQIGVKFTPWRQIALRGTYGRGFRAPSAAESGASGELFGAGTFTDTTLCPTPVPAGMAAGPGDYSAQCSFFVTGFQASNPHLEPVKSTNWTLGVVLQPIEPVSVSVDYYNIKVTGDVVSDFESGGLNNYISQVRGAPTIQPYCPTSYVNGCTTAQEIEQASPVGPVIANTYEYENSGFTHTSGFDVDLKAHYDAGRLGLLSAEATWTHLLTYQLLAFDGSVGGPVLFELAGTHGPSGISGDTGNPKDRAELMTSWQKGPLTLSPSLMFVGHFGITDPSAGVTTCAQGITAVAKFLSYTPQLAPFCTVKYFLETNVYGSYQVSGNFQLHAAVTDLFNKQPPVDVSTYGGGTYLPPYDPALESDGAMGRFFTVGFDYEF